MKNVTNKKSKNEIEKLAREIKLLVLDVDGVLTRGALIFSAIGEEIKVFGIRDGLGIRRVLQHGIEVAVISGRKSEAINVRMRELGVKHVYQKISDKLPVLDELAAQLQIDYAQIAYVGDDLPDLPCITRVGLGIAVGDAAHEVLQNATWKTQARGGHGAVREVCELLLKARGEWEVLL